MASHNHTPGLCDIEYELMRMLYRRGPLNMYQLAKQTGYNQTHAKYWVKHLLGKKLVTKENGNGDDLALYHLDKNRVQFSDGALLMQSDGNIFLFGKDTANTQQLIKTLNSMIKKIEK